MVQYIYYAKNIKLKLKKSDSDIGGPIFISNLISINIQKSGAPVLLPKKERKKK